MTSPQLYSASKTSDLESALLLLTRLFPNSPMAGLGFSLGGAILAKYMGQAGKRTPFIGAVCVGAPYELDKTCAALDSTYLTQIYSYVMGRNLMNVLRRHVDTLALLPSLWGVLELAFGERIKPNSDEPLPEPSKEGPRRGTLRFVDHYVTSKVGGHPSPYGEFPFASAEDYYVKSSPTNVLLDVARPLLAVNADDDPIVPLHALATFREKLKENPNMVLAHSRCGGHLGWFASHHAMRWAFNPIGEFLTALFARVEAPDAPRPTKGLGSGGPRLSQWKFGKVDAQQVDVEVLPASALPTILSGVSPKTHVEGDVPDDVTDLPTHAWLQTPVLQHLPLVHPRDSPARLAQESPAPLPKGRTLRLTLVRHLY